MAEKPSFEAALAALEAAVEQLESGDLSLDDALSCFERGVKSAALCRQRLQSVETHVDKLLRDAEGKLSVREADDL